MEVEVNVEDIIDRIKRIQAGELPKDNVSIEELRKAIEMQRSRREVSSSASGSSTPAKKSGVKRLELDLNLGDDLFKGL